MTTLPPLPARQLTKTCSCGLVIGSIHNGMIVRHDLVIDERGLGVRVYRNRELSCTLYRLSTRPGYADRVEEVCVIR